MSGSSQRNVDLTHEIGEGCRKPVMQAMFDTAYRCRPTFDGTRWLLQEPLGGFQTEPLLRIGSTMPLDAANSRDVGERIARFLSPDLKFSPENRPKEVRISKGYGAISEIEALQYEAYLAIDAATLASTITDKIIPYVRETLGATHCCVVRPNLKAQQTRISLAKTYWAASVFPRAQLQQKIVEERVLDAVLPLAHEMSNWLYAFISSSTQQVALSFQLLGGYVLFFRDRPWAFPYAAVAGMQGRFNANPPMDTTDGGTRSGIWLRHGSYQKVYQYLRAATELVNTLAFYAVNPANFLNGQKIDSAKQIQFISALGLLFADVLAANESASQYNKISFAFSALDKLANIVMAMNGPGINETSAFKACFSTGTVFGLRWIAKHLSGDPGIAEVLRVQAWHVLQVHQAVRDQTGGALSELERLNWLRSYRNLKHGTFLHGDQFKNLFVKATGLAPSELMHVTMAVVIGFGIAPDSLLRLLAAQAKAV